MKTRVQKWGNSLAVRIPKTLADETGFAENSAVELSVEDGRIVVGVATPPRLRLDDLLKQVTPANLHGEVGYGRPSATVV